MTLDWLDSAFLARKPSSAAAVPTPDRAPLAAALQDSRDEVSAPMSPLGGLSATPSAPAGSVVTRLLAAVPSEWDGLADAIESAADAGRRVVAFTGGVRGEGRSTVVAGVAEVLRRRGRSVACHARAPLLLPIDEAEEARAAAIVLVDAGPWFTTGPLRRRTVERAALGCDAAVLVRRADALPCPAWSDCLGAIGLTVIGEAVTFEPVPAAG